LKGIIVLPKPDLPIRQQLSEVEPKSKFTFREFTMPRQYSNKFDIARLA